LKNRGKGLFKIGKGGGCIFLSAKKKSWSVTQLKKREKKGRVRVSQGGVKEHL